MLRWSNLLFILSDYFSSVHHSNLHFLFRFLDTFLLSLIDIIKELWYEMFVLQVYSQFMWTKDRKRMQFLFPDFRGRTRRVKGANPLFHSGFGRGGGAVPSILGKDWEQKLTKRKKKFKLKTWELWSANSLQKSCFARISISAIKGPAPFLSLETHGKL